MSSYKLPDLAYLHGPKRDRFQQFINNSAYILNLLYDINYQPNVVKRPFTEKLTKHPNEGNMEYLKNLICMNNGAKSLIIAPTGSGKTYSVDAIFKQIKAESEEEQILCLLCPNRVQNIQNEKSDVYSFEALIEGVCLEDNGQNIRQISAVYDKIPEIRKYKKEHPGCRLRIVIDECHNLISANIFREQAIQAIMRLIQSNVADSYTFITATYDNMCCFAFDNIVLFEDKSYKPVFGSIDIRFTEKKYFENLVMDTALKERKAYIRLNHRDSIKRIEKALLDKGQKCFSVTAGDKGYTKNSDGTITYNNTIFDHITNHDDLYNNEGEADTILATSLLDAGTNFTKYSPESTPVFAVFSPELMNIDEIEQSFNRFRPQKDKAGNIIQLDHAVILHQRPTHDITRAMITKHDSAGNSTPIKAIPLKALIYTDKTTPEEEKEGRFNGVLTIPGTYFEDLEDGKYVIEFVFGHNFDVPCKLHVNYTPKTDIDTLEALEEIHQKNIYKVLNSDKDNYDHTAHIISMDAQMDINAITEILNRQSNRIPEDNDWDFFNYHTGDETVSSTLPLRPFTFFTELTSILTDYLQRAKGFQKRLYGYRQINNLVPLNEESMGGMTEQEHMESLLNMFRSSDQTGISNALYLTDSLSLWIDYNKLFNIAYSAYQRQYYFYPERLADELQQRLNIPVSISCHTPNDYSIEKIEEDRETLLNNLNSLYQNPSTKDILCDVLHNGRSIPIDLDDGLRKMLSEILQSRLYKEYKDLKALSTTLTFDYIIKVLNFVKNERDTNKHIKRLKYMFINQSIVLKGALPFSSKPMQMQFTEQKVLIDIINGRKKAKGKGKEIKNITLSKGAMESLCKEFNEKMSAIIPSYAPMAKTPFKNLVYSVYIIINQNSKSREPELTELILKVDDVPFK